MCVYVWLTICLYIVKSSGHFFVILFDLKEAYDVFNHSYFFKCILLFFLRYHIFLIFLLVLSYPSPLLLLSVNGKFCSLVLGSYFFSGFIVSLGDLIRSFGFKCHPNASDLRFLFPILALIPSFRLLSSTLNLILVLGYLIGLSNLKHPK